MVSASVSDKVKNQPLFISLIALPERKTAPPREDSPFLKGVFNLIFQLGASGFATAKKATTHANPGTDKEALLKWM